MKEIDRQISDYASEDSSLNKVIFSQKDEIAISGGEDGVARVYDVNGEGKLILKFELKEHHGGVTGLAVNKSVTRVVSSSGDKTL